MSPQRHVVTSLSLVFVVILSCQSVHSQLRVGFYRFSCPFAEFIVKDEVKEAFDTDPGVAAGLVRMHFHDCFVRVRCSSLFCLVRLCFLLGSSIKLYPLSSPIIVIELRTIIHTSFKLLYHNLYVFLNSAYIGL